MTADSLGASGNEPLTLLRPMEEETPRCDVCVVGAGPAGLMLASNLVRFGVKTTIVDERADPTTVGRADGLQPKTLETLQMMRMGDQLLRLGTRVYDICMWSSDNAAGTPQRLGREIHYPDAAVDLLEPYILLCHQGMVEGMFLDDLARRGVAVQRSTRFDGCDVLLDERAGREGRQHDDDDDAPLSVRCHYNVTRDERRLTADYVVGCDGAHSRVRDAIPGAQAAGTPHDSVWGVLDGEVDTDFPDLWSKTVVYSAQHGSVLIIPRERNLTRLYIEIKAAGSSRGLGQAFVMERARAILAPFRLAWRSVEWFGRYQVAQRVARRFADPRARVLIAGDASHAHSPKAAQGMNTSMHDAWNLAWKLNLVVRRLARRRPLLDTYEHERQKIAHDLIRFDLDHANHIAAGDADALARNFRTNVRFIAGVGVAYAANVLNPAADAADAADEPSHAAPGHNLPPAKATRYVDANPVDLQLDIPVLGQFRIYVVADVAAAPAAAFVAALCAALAAPASLVSRLSAAARRSYAQTPRTVVPEDQYFRPERYTAVSDLFTFALITAAPKNTFEIADLPPLLASTPWTVYLDDQARHDTRGLSCADKWLGGLAPGEVAVLNVRPDGYVGSVNRWAASAATGVEAAQWVGSYYDGFLRVPEDAL